MALDSPTPTQQYIVDLVDSEPGMSNADIAEETGTHTALVRDLRKTKQAAAESDDDASPGALSSQTRVLDDLSGTQAAVLQRAAAEPDLSNARLAEAVGTHTALVRDLRSDVQAEVLAHTLRNPDATNADIAEELGTHTAIVRDARSGLEAEILERSVRNPGLSNAQLAEELGTHIATVRDARAAYEDGIGDVDLTPSDDGGTEPADSTASEPATTDGGDGMSGTVVALLVGVVLLVAVLVLVSM
ncbi:hypothetical protein NDI56_11875 [Haloarcula sp. S1CR25-12]|uniref:Winged helix-turn-helix transcriptional regulator n=1 Tax=Haloarcula saliterrae TaxID=2950534 RepID=A0ABU2FD04_9EURY|nr:hypothetical protein [Haloarcula sp. S1CR25-12]MDS0260092.1 hypothetical protein [Haloarcula sp. S1CR25-12]